MYAEADIVGGGSSDDWSKLTGIPPNINTLAIGGVPTSGQIFQWSSATTGNFINTPSFIQNFSYSALISVPNAVAALSSLTPASGQIVEYTGAGTAHMIPTPSGGGGGVITPGTTHIGSLVTWDSLTGAAIADPNVVPSANGYSLISAANYASMRSLLDIGSVGQLNDLSTVLSAGSNITLNTSGGVTTISANALAPITAATYIGATVNAEFNPSGSSQNVNLPAGTQAGDLCIFITNMIGAVAAAVPIGFTTEYAQSYSGTIGTNQFAISYKVILTTDITAGHITSASLTGTHCQNQIIIYRGPDSISFAAGDVGNSSNPDTVAIGFTKNAKNIGTWAYCFNDTAAASTGSMSVPGSFTTRANAASTNWNYTSADAIPYVNGTPYQITIAGSVIHTGLVFQLYNSAISAGNVSSVNGHTGIVVLSYTDLSLGTVSLLNDLSSRLSPGTNITMSTSGGVTTINSTGGGGGGLTSFNGRTTPAAVLAVSDVYPLLSAGTGISLSNIGSSVQITASGGGGVPIGYYGAAENSILTGNSASTNVTNLNNLITTLNSGGGGTIWFNGSGAYQINGTINLKSNVSIIMSKGAYISWTGSTSGTIFTSLTSDILNNCNYQINVTEGSSFSGIALRLHSHYNCNFDIYAFGVETSAGTFAYLSADSGAGTGVAGTRNTAFNQYHFTHMGTVGSGLILDGLASGLGGNPQVNTDMTFNNIWFTNALTMGIRLENWSDSITFSGFTYVQASGAGSVGFIVNEAASATPSVYNIHIEQLAIDTFGTVSPGRYGVFLNQSKGITCDQFYQGPTAELGDIVGTLCSSYQFRQLCSTTGVPATATADQIVYRQKGIASPAP